MCPFHDRELAAARSLLHFNGANRSLLNPRENHARACPVCDRGGEPIIGIQNNEATGIDRFRQSTSFLRSRVSWSSKLDVRDPEVRNVVGVGRAAARARAVLARTI